MLKLDWLGPPTATLDGLPVHFETRKITALLAYLSLNPNGSPREKLAALFWPEYDQPHALANLRRALGSLTRALPPGTIEAGRECLRWTPEHPTEVDVLQLQASFQTVRGHHPRGADLCPECLRVLEAAGELYRGEFLEGLNLPDAPAFDDWQYLTREELKRELAWSLEQLARELARQAAWGKAIRAARRRVSLDRLDASAQSALVEILARSGQLGQAQRQADEYKRLYQGEFGQEPDQAAWEPFRRALQPIAQEDRPRRAAPAAGGRVLLNTKLYLPRVKPSRVSRPRLLEKLSAIPEYKLTLVCAPAGFGKTSLLAEWAAQTGLLTGWFSLDGSDNDPHAFLSYLCAALDGLHEGVAENARTLLQAAPPVPPQTIITVLLKDLEAIQEPLALVLDDYQFITSPQIQEAVYYFLDRANPNLHLVFASRADPPLPLARLRASGELLEVRIEDLRFNLEECADFFNQVMRLDITPADIQALAERTEGWAAGLQMAAILLQGAPDREKVIQTFSGSHRYILEYLTQEVLDRQPVHIRDFLLKTSILERLCGELCETVVGASPEPAYAVLEYLERANLFLIPLDQEHRWYRYHHLFADLLKLQLQRNPPVPIPDLHLRASGWYAGNAQIEPAIEHAFTAGDLAQAANLIEQHSQSLGFQVGFARLQVWHDSLPPEMLVSRAWIAISQAWLYLVSGKLPPLIRLMDQIQGQAQTSWAERYSETSRQDLLANITCLRAYIAFFSGDLPQSLVLAEEALQLNRPENGVLRVRLLVQNGEFSQTNRDHPRACKFLLPAIDLGISLQDFQSTTTALVRVYRSLQLLGQLNQAEAVIEKVMQAMSEAGRMNSPIAGKVSICWGDLLRERGQMAAAREWLERGLVQSRLYSIPFDIITALVFNVKWCCSQGLWDEGLRLLDEGLPLLSTYAIPPPIEFSWWLWRARACLGKGDQQGVYASLQGLSRFSEGNAPFMLEDTAMVLARLYQQEGRHAEALDRLESLAGEAEAGGRCGVLVSVLLLQAISLAALDQKAAALDRLEKGLRLAQPQGYRITFLDEGPPVEALLKELPARDLPPPIRTYAQDLLQAFAAGSG